MAQGVVNIIREWLFGPPIPAEPVICDKCELLQEQLTFANYDRKVLLENVIRLAQPKNDNEEPIDVETLFPIQSPRHKPWRVRQAELEAESREKKQQLNGGPRPVVTPESIENLEKELGVTHETVQETR